MSVDGSNSIPEASMTDNVRFIVYCDDFWAASKYAARRDWHLSWWKHLGGDYAPTEPIVFVRDFVNEWLPED